MSITLTVRDELPHGKVLNELSFEVQSERLPVRELIRQRVHQEVSLYNLGEPGNFKGLVQPSKVEAWLNDNKPQKRRQIDWQKQADLALQAFEQNAFFILVDDHQVESLDEFVELRADTQVSFLRLVPLVGG